MANFVERASGKIQKLSDEQLERLLNDVQEENEKYGCIIESLPSGIITLDRNWKVIRMNKAAKRLVPCVPHFNEKKDELWNFINDRDLSEFLKDSAEKKHINASREFSVDCAGKVKFITVSVIPFLQNSEIAGTIIMIEDRTAKRQQEILSHRMENLRSLTNLAASVAHEIKNPLGAISIHIQLIQKAVKKAREGSGELPQEKFMENYLSVVNEEIENLNKIVMDFLFAVRPVQATFTLCSPDQILERTLSFFSPELERNGISLDSYLESEDSRVLIDEKLFREVVVNILQNAQAAILSKRDSGSHVDWKPQIAVSSKVDRKNDFYVLTIMDNGCGMDEDTCSRIFEPYYTTKANGTGLGLTTVYKIIKEFRGDISAKSQFGLGTVFSVSIPLPQENTMLLEGCK